MKLRLTVEFDLPDACAEWSDGELHQMVFDSYTNYVTVRHAFDHMKWTIDSEKPGATTTSKDIALIHKNWTDIASKASETAIIERLDSAPKV